MKLLKIFSITPFVFASAVALAADESNTRSTLHSDYSTTRIESGWLPAVGLTYGNLQQGGNTSLHGDSVGAKLIGTYYFDQSSWLADVGLGAQKFYLQDSQPTVGVLSSSARYGFGNRWSVGPVADIYFGNGNAFGTANNQNLFLGAVAYKEFLLTDDQLMRIGLKYDTALLTSGQTSSFLGLTAEWAVGSNNSVVR